MDQIYCPELDHYNWPLTIAYQNTHNCEKLSTEDLVEQSLEALDNVYEYFVSNDSKRGMIKNTGKLLSSIASFGGTYYYELHSKHYNDIYAALYEPKFNYIKGLESETKALLSSIGEGFNQLNKVLKPIQKILKRKMIQAENQLITIDALNKLNTNLNSAINIGFGGLLGGTAAMGAWAIVSSIGSASTGTAISSLSGIAASNATLAWFGGGSLATGGAGMAGGLWVLGGIVAVPVLYFSTKNAYKKCHEIEMEKQKLIKEYDSLCEIEKQANEQIIFIKRYQVFFNDTINEYLPLLKNEYSKYLKHNSFFRDLFTKDKSPEELEALSNLNKLVTELFVKLGFISKVIEKN